MNNTNFISSLFLQSEVLFVWINHSGANILIFDDC